MGREGKGQSPLMASGDFIRIKATIEVFLEEFDPSQNYLLSISDIEGYETQFIEFKIWDRNDGPIPGIKLFKDLNIYLEREYCEY